MTGKYEALSELAFIRDVLRSKMGGTLNDDLCTRFNKVAAILGSEAGKQGTWCLPNK